MAEEIVAFWANEAALVGELISDKDEERRTRAMALEITAPLEMHFRLQDGHGNPIVWPLTLISDTIDTTSDSP